METPPNNNKISLNSNHDYFTPCNNSSSSLLHNNIEKEFDEEINKFRSDEESFNNRTIKNLNDSSNDDNDNNTDYLNDYSSLDYNMNIDENFNLSNQSNYYQEQLETPHNLYLHRRHYHLPIHKINIQTPNTEEKSTRAIQLYRQREAKWLDIISSMNPSMARDSRKIKKLVRLGIPESLRGKAWQFMAGADKLRRPGYYDRDIHRCYPDHIQFRKETGFGQEDLHDVLKAYAHYNPSIGYCQGMGRLVGMMLMQMPVEDSFWLLVATIEKYMVGYFTPNLTQIRINSVIFEQLLIENYPKLAQHLAENDVIPLIYVTQWFMTLFTMTLPWASVLRVWDMFYFEGVNLFYRIGLAIMECSQDYILKECPTSSEILEFLLHIPHEFLTPDLLLEAAFKIKIKKRVRKLTKKIEAMEKGKDNDYPNINNLDFINGTVNIKNASVIDPNNSGGIGKGIAIHDTLADTEDDLMFFTGDTVTILKHIKDEYFLGYCEGVIGKFKGSAIKFNDSPKRQSNFLLPSDAIQNHQNPIIIANPPKRSSSLLLEANSNEIKFNNENNNDDNSIKISSSQKRQNTSPTIFISSDTASILEYNNPTSISILQSKDQSIGTDHHDTSNNFSINKRELVKYDTLENITNGNNHATTAAPKRSSSLLLEANSNEIKFNNENNNDDNSIKISSSQKRQNTSPTIFISSDTASILEYNNPTSISILQSKDQSIGTAIFLLVKYDTLENITNGNNHATTAAVSTKLSSSEIQNNENNNTTNTLNTPQIDSFIESDQNKNIAVPTFKIDLVSDTETKSPTSEQFSIKENPKVATTSKDLKNDETKEPVLKSSKIETSIVMGKSAIESLVTTEPPSQPLPPSSPLSSPNSQNQVGVVKPKKEQILTIDEYGFYNLGVVTYREIKNLPIHDEDPSVKFIVVDVGKRRFNPTSVFDKAQYKYAKDHVAMIAFEILYEEIEYEEKKLIDKMDLDYQRLIGNVIKTPRFLNLLDIL
ncbi:11071_t:CDS:10 [Entrophospora sp. SA101]|nr:11071_t:CDS:10 [Entrophospora sp. SA101]